MKAYFWIAIVLLVGFILWGRNNYFEGLTTPTEKKEEEVLLNQSLDETQKNSLTSNQKKILLRAIVLKKQELTKPEIENFIQTIGQDETKTMSDDEIKQILTSLATPPPSTSSTTETTPELPKEVESFVSLCPTNSSKWGYV